MKPVLSVLSLIMPLLGSGLGLIVIDRLMWGQSGNTVVKLFLFCGWVALVSLLGLGMAIMAFKRMEPRLLVYLGIFLNSCALFAILLLFLG